MEEEILSLSSVDGAVDILSSVRKANAKLKFLSNFTGESDFIDVMEEVIKSAFQVEGTWHGTETEHC